MNSPRDLRRRIKSVSGTAQITKAMQMVAASKMRKAQQAAIAAPPFARLLYRIQRSATARLHEFAHPLLETGQVRRRAVILIAGDKGLCGALNTNVFRLASQLDPESTIFITAGRKAAQFVARTRRQLAAEFAYGDSPTFAEARAIAAFARDLFLKGEVDEVRIIATRFVNTLTQEAVSLEYLPVGAITDLRIPDAEKEVLAADTEETVFEPGAEAVLALSARPLSQHLPLLRAAERQGQRAKRAHGVDEERDRQRREPDRRLEARIQQAAAGQHHQGIAGDCGRTGGVRAFSSQLSAFS